MRTFYMVLSEYKNTPTIDVVSNYLIELLSWFSERLPIEHPIKLTKEIDSQWRNFVKRASCVEIDGEQFELNDDMFRQCLAQLPRAENITDGEFLFRQLFNELKWDYDKYVEPHADDNDQIVYICL